MKVFDQTFFKKFDRSRVVTLVAARKRRNAPVQYVPSVVNIPFPLWRNADVNPRGILGDGTEYIIILILRNVPSVLLCKAFSLAFCFKEKALNGFRGAKVLPSAT